MLTQYYNKWVLDRSSLLIRYDEKLNHYNPIPLHDRVRKKFQYILGIDIGLRDADALAVIGWCDSDPNIYLIEEMVTKDQDITTLVNQAKHLIQKYDPQKIVMDEGALGKKIAEEIRRRHQVAVQPAEKSRKMENIAFLNDWLRLGKFKAHHHSRFAQDSYQLQIDWDKSTTDKIVVKDTFHSDVIDAVLYSFKICPHFIFEKKIHAPKWGTPEWQKQQEEVLEANSFRKAREFYDVGDEAEVYFEH